MLHLIVPMGLPYGIFPLNIGPKHFIKIMGIHMKNLHSTIRLDMRYYVLEFIVIEAVGPTVSWYALCANVDCDK